MGCGDEAEADPVAVAPVPSFVRTANEVGKRAPELVVLVVLVLGPEERDELAAGIGAGPVAGRRGMPELVMSRYKLEWFEGWDSKRGRDGGVD